MARNNAIQVVAGLIRRRDGKILICLRPKHLDQGGLWEFPGGKREDGEGRFDALRRELHEELGIEIRSAVPLLRLTHRYPTKSIDLDVWEVTAWQGSAFGREGQKVEWVAPSQLDHYAFPSANKAIITAARLPRVVVTLPDLARSLAALDAWLNAGARCFLLSSQHLKKNLDDPNLTQVGQHISRSDATLVVDLPPETATEFVSGERLECLRRQIDCDLLVAYACHTPAQLERAQKAGADMLLVGPILSTDFEAGEGAIGWSETLRLVAKTVIPTFAFGQLEPEDSAHAILSGCQGVVLPANAWSTDPISVLKTAADAMSRTEVADDCG